MAFLSFASLARAQGRIAGVVRDSAGNGIASAEVAVAGTALRTESGDDGRFTLADVPLGAVVLRVRRLGFRPASSDVAVQSGATSRVSVTVAAVAQQLAPVIVRSDAERSYSGYLADFYRRRDRGNGRFITQDQIAKRAPQQLTDMFRTIPGMTITSPSIGDSKLRIRGNMCAPAVWLDGMPAIASEFDLDTISPEDVAGIEIYSGASTVPVQFVVPFGPTACGTVVIWTRHGEPASRQSRLSMAELDTLMARRHVYTADEVDRPAQLDTAAAAVTPTYPDSMYRAATPGRVVIQCVVDTTGRIEPNTLQIISSTNQLLTSAVLEAFVGAKFKPATIGTMRVRQLVQVPFAFVVPARGAVASHLD